MATDNKPVMQELLSDAVLAQPISRLNLVPFSGMEDPGPVWRLMVQDDPNVFQYYRDLDEKDAQISQALETRKTGVLKPERQLVAASKDSEDQARHDFAKEALDGIPNFQGVLEELLDAPGYGVTFAEILWARDGSRIIIEKIKPRAQEWFLFNRATNFQNGPLRLKKNVWDIEGAEVPESKFLVFTFGARYGNRRGRPLMRRCFWPSWFKRQDMKFWLKWLEKGSGTVAVTYPSGDESARDMALKAAEDISAVTAVAMPEGLQINEALLKAARTGSTEIYRAMIKDICDDAIVKVILGQTLTSQGSDQGSGSRALGEVHEDVRQEKIAGDAKALAEVINDQLLYWLFRFNYPDAERRPKWRIQIEPPKNLTERSQVDSRLQQMGLPLTDKYLRETYSVPEPEPEEQILQPRAAASPFAAGPGFNERDPRDGRRDMGKIESEALREVEADYAALIHEAIRRAGNEL
jgi:phage gp29-like protein